MAAAHDSDQTRGRTSRKCLKHGMRDEIYRTNKVITQKSDLRNTCLLIILYRHTIHTLLQYSDLIYVFFSVLEKSYGMQSTIR